MIKSLTFSIFIFISSSIILFGLIIIIGLLFGLDNPPPGTGPGLQNLGHAYLFFFNAAIGALCLSLLIGGVANYKTTKLLSRNLRLSSLLIYFILIALVISIIIFYIATEGNISFRFNVQ